MSRTAVIDGSLWTNKNQEVKKYKRKVNCLPDKNAKLAKKAPRSKRTGSWVAYNATLSLRIYSPLLNMFNQKHFSNMTSDPPYCQHCDHTFEVILILNRPRIENFHESIQRKMFSK